MLAIFLSILLSLPFLYLDISVLAPGMIRPGIERTAIRSSVSAYLDSAFYADGELATKGSILFSFNCDHLLLKTRHASLQVEQLRVRLRDLELLTKHEPGSSAIFRGLKTDLYRSQWLTAFSRETEHLIQIEKANEEVQVCSYLLKEKAISIKDYKEVESKYHGLTAAYERFKAERMGLWQQQRAQLQKELTDALATVSELQFAGGNYQLHAPVAGTIQYLKPSYRGSYIEAGEILCLLSPEMELVAECLVAGTEVGMIKSAQKVSFKIDAFNYSYFGILTGKVLSVDNDYTLVENKPVFKVRCAIDEKHVKLPNGFSAELKKGLTLQARFILTRRSLWQLIFDKLDDWLNPVAGKQVK